MREYENAAISGTTDACPVSQLMLSVVAKIRPHALIIRETDSLDHDKCVLAMARRSYERRAAKYTCCGEYPDRLSRKHAHREPDKHNGEVQQLAGLVEHPEGDELQRRARTVQQAWAVRARGK